MGLNREVFEDKYKIKQMTYTDLEKIQLKQIELLQAQLAEAQKDLNFHGDRVIEGYVVCKDEPIYEVWGYYKNTQWVVVTEEEYKTYDSNDSNKRIVYRKD